jgi:hypothetical protein
MFEDDKELPPGQTDEIGRRMAEVIDEQDEAAVEHVSPHWELFYDDEHGDAEQIVHLHDGDRVPGRLTARSDGSSFAECTQCKETLEISKAAPRPRREARDKAPAG